MPELAEVEYYRKIWNPTHSHPIRKLHLNPEKRIFLHTDTSSLASHLKNTAISTSSTFGKQMLFTFTPSGHLGIHLGMTGKLLLLPPNTPPEKHDHLILYTEKHSLTYRDPRCFGRIHFHPESGIPPWWKNHPPEILSSEFTSELLSTFLKKRKNTPIKSTLLLQTCFPGIGNWMADEILWRSAIHPLRKPTSFRPEEFHLIWKTTRQVSRDALRVIGSTWATPPDSWLFNHRWKKGGICPKTKTPLEYIKIAGRTTCFSPVRQKQHPHP